MATNWWAAYSPDKERPWDRRRVVHLHRRAGFAATWDEIERDLKDGPEKSIERVLTGKANQHVPPDIAAVANVIEEAAIQQDERNRLIASAIYRQINAAHQLAEKMALHWHDHFATAQSKVKNLRQMHEQYEVFRSLGLGKFGPLLHASVKQPALLVFLDAQLNRPGKANENLAREVMELFALGVGNYTETDIKEAARALTGWLLDDGKFYFNQDFHDAGEKTILGKKAKWTGDQFIDHLLAQPACAKRIAWRLSKVFFGDRGLPKEAHEQLANHLRERELDVSAGIALIVKSKLFYEANEIGQRVLSPVEYVVGTVRALGLFDPAPSTVALGEWATRMGQSIYEPPNVGGWPGGRQWIATRSLVARANFAQAITQANGFGQQDGYQPEAAAKKHGFGSTGRDLLTYHCQLLFGSDPTTAQRDELEKLRPGAMFAQLLASPRGQLG